MPTIKLILMIVFEDHLFLTPRIGSISDMIKPIDPIYYDQIKQST